MRTSEDRSGPLATCTCTCNPCQSTGTSSPVSTGDLPGLPVQVTNGPDRSSEVLIVPLTQPRHLRLSGSQGEAWDHWTDYWTSIGGSDAQKCQKEARDHPCCLFDSSKTSRGHQKITGMLVILMYLS